MNEPVTQSDRGERPVTVLAIDTATDAVLTGVVDLRPGRWPLARAERIVADGRRHAEILTTLISEVLAEAGLAAAELDAVVVGCGPGPFTGLRVGMATGAAFADALGIPAYPVCSLDAIAAQARWAEQADADVDLLVVTDARRREVYWARYRGDHRVAGPDVLAPEALAASAHASGVDLVAAAPAFRERFGGRPAATTAPSVSGLVAAAGADLEKLAPPQPLTPLYLRRPDAVELKDQKRKSLLPEPSPESLR